MFDIVALDLSHISQMADIEKQCFKTPWSYNMLADELKNDKARYFVAVKDGKVIAYLGLYIILDEAHITNIAVIDSYRRKGIASTLLYTAINKLNEKSINKITLEVNSKNRKAIALYEKFGFKLCGCRPKYYEGVDDALIYWKE